MIKDNSTTSRATRELIFGAAAALKERAEEVNRLNVFPVPDGDTGTNMSLTMDTVVREVSDLPENASIADVCHAVTHGSLMGARGNSGVILSQILRGLCEGIDGAEVVDAALFASALRSATDVAYQAVRKPVEGTMLTVIRETADAAEAAVAEGLDLDETLARTAEASFESVRNTPELLPVLKENGVVDAGGFGLAILLEGFVAGVLGKEVQIGDITSAAAPLFSVEPVDDWDDDEYLYCTEFLLFGTGIDRDAVNDYISSMGGSELVVGDNGEYKVHVHTNDPGAVLAHVTALGEVAEVHVNNMRRQQGQRDEKLRAEDAPGKAVPTKPVGFVAVASGEGLTKILESLGVDVVVSGGQTMNPSTEDLLSAIERVPAEQVIVLPNNKNIVMAANAAASVAPRPTVVVPTISVPAGFAALLAYDGSEDVADIAPEMEEAACAVRTGEVTFAVKDAKGKGGDIKAGQVIGIVDDKEIEVVGDEVTDVAVRLAGVLAQDAETLTLFAGADMGDDELDALRAAIEDANPDIDVETHRGEQPLYPVVMSAE
ncbi:MAG TPA: DAK2 domain-containing protein [Coriobacteriia bacterium]|nr:DAK2 domain-containing protein [Coriobacteriia bacterium]